jgi:hypothetical protein
MFRALSAFCLLAALTALCFAIPIADSPARVIQDTGWIDVPLDGQFHTYGTLKAPNGGIVVTSMEFRYAYEAENFTNAPVSGYQAATRFEYRIGDEGTELISQACGGALAATDGVNWTGHLAIPTAPLGDGLDWHVVPRAASVPFNLGSYQPGVYAVRIKARQDLQDWGSGHSIPDGEGELTSRYAQVRLRSTVL